MGKTDFSENTLLNLLDGSLNITLVVYGECKRYSEQTKEVPC